MAAIGIDFGFNDCRVSLLTQDDEQEAGVYKIDLNDRYTSTVIGFDGDETLFGFEAINDAQLNPEYVVRGLKRLIGRHSNDETLKKHSQDFNIKTVEVNNEVVIEVNNKQFRTTNLLSRILKNAKEETELCLSRKVEAAVISVPSQFTHLQRKAVIDAAKEAKFDEIQLINDTTAVAVYYSYEKMETEQKKVIVIDCGATSVDIALIDINNYEINVRSTNGSTSFGGVDIDSRLMHLCCQKLTEKEPNFTLGPKKLHQLRRDCEAAKKTFKKKLYNSTKRIKINQSDNVSITIPITINEFDKHCNDLIHCLEEMVKGVLQEASVSDAEVDEIILVGGLSELLNIEFLISDIFKNKPINKNIDYGEAVVKGAAIIAASLSNVENERVKRIKVKETTPFAILIANNCKAEKTVDLIQRNTPIPFGNSKKFINPIIDEQQKATINILLTDEDKLKFHQNIDTSKQCSVELNMLNYQLSGFMKLINDADDHLMIAGKDYQHKIKVNVKFDKNGLCIVNATEIIKKELNVEEVKQRINECDLNQLKSMRANKFNDETLKCRDELEAELSNLRQLKLNCGPQLNDIIKREIQNIEPIEIIINNWKNVSLNELNEKIEEVKWIKEKIESHLIREVNEETIEMGKHNKIKYNNTPKISISSEEQAKADTSDPLQSTSHSLFNDKMDEFFDSVISLNSDKVDLMDYIKTLISNLKDKLVNAKGILHYKVIAPFQEQIIMTADYLNNNTDINTDDLESIWKKLKGLEYLISLQAEMAISERLEEKRRLLNFMDAIQRMSVLGVFSHSKGYEEVNSQLNKKIIEIESKLTMNTLMSENIKEYESKLDSMIDGAYMKLLKEECDRMIMKQKLNNMLTSIEVMLNEQTKSVSYLNIDEIANEVMRTRQWIRSNFNAKEVDISNEIENMNTMMKCLHVFVKGGH